MFSETMFARITLVNLDFPPRRKNKLRLALIPAFKHLVLAARGIGIADTLALREKYGFALAVALQGGDNSGLKRDVIVGWLNGTVEYPLRKPKTGGFKRKRIFPRFKHDSYTAALAAAVVAKDEPVLKALLAMMKKKGITVPSWDNILCPFGDPLTYAVGNDDDTLVRLLLKYRVALDARNHQGEGALTIAITRENEHIFTLLLDHLPSSIIDRRERHNYTPLTVAAAYGSVNVVKLLLSRDDIDIDVNNQTDQGSTPLWLAAKLGHTSIVEALLSHPKTDKNMVAHGQTPLMMATFQGHIEIVRMLLSDPDVKPGPHCATLLAAILGGHLEIARLLIHRRDININDFSPSGGTPLVYAASQLQAALPERKGIYRGIIEEILTVRGEEDLKINTCGDDALELVRLSCETGYERVLRYMLTKRETVARTDWNMISGDLHDTPLAYAARTGTANIVRILLFDIPTYQGVEVRKPDVNRRAGNGRTPLFWACMEGFPEVVKVLLEREDLVLTGPEVRDDAGMTPLGIAVERGHKEVERLLMEEMERRGLKEDLGAEASQTRKGGDEDSRDTQA